MGRFTRLNYVDANAVKKNDAWAETLTFSQVDSTGSVVVFTVPTRARIALYADAKKAAAVVLSLDSQAGADGLITLAQVGDDATAAWAKTIVLAVGTYYGDLQLDWASGTNRTPWTIADIVIEVVLDYAG